MAIEFTIYGRPGCHLCDVLTADLAALLEGMDPVVVRHVNIDGVPDLVARYALRIPVLAVGEEELSEYRLDEPRVREFLARFVNEAG
ncbi:MAG: glutaredoxin family protein [Pseudomonadota bacterium]|nr:glutaredoxin family protein [Pseudomonadota bacterium]